MASNPSRRQPRSRREFRVAIVCALTLESNAVNLIFDGMWGLDMERFGKRDSDTNQYTTGWIGMHNVVLVQLSSMGKVHATKTTTNLRSTFPSIQVVFLVGICGGCPRLDARDGGVLLGDVVVGSRLFQHDLGRRHPDRFEHMAGIEETGDEIRNLINKLETDMIARKLKYDTAMFLRKLQQDGRDQFRSDKYRFPGTEHDKLYHPEYRHKHRGRHLSCICQVCRQDHDPVCENVHRIDCASIGCEASQLVYRPKLAHKMRREQESLYNNSGITEYAQDPDIHLGGVASGDTVLRSAAVRDRISRDYNVIAFEMEGSGVWGSGDERSSCIVVKSVCDYADSHKNKHWQDFAAATAACATKAILNTMSPTDMPTPQIPAPPEEVRTQLPEPSRQSTRTMERDFRNISIGGGQSWEYSRGGRGGGGGDYSSRSDGLGISQTVTASRNMIPFPQDKGYVARPEVQAWLEAKTNVPNTRAAIYGFAGAGKSQAVIHHAYQVAGQNADAWVFWIHASSPERFRAGYRKMAQRLALPGWDNKQVDVLELVKDWLADESNGPWLMVLDNVDSLDTLFSGPQQQNSGTGAQLLASYLPKRGRGSILVTSRNYEVAEKLAPGNVYHLSGMDPGQALQLMQAKLGANHQNSEADLRELAAELDNIPLAVTQAAAFLQRRKPAVSARVLLDQLRSNVQAVLGFFENAAGDLRRDDTAENSVLKTLGITFDQISQERPRAAELLWHMSMFHCQGIPHAALSHFWSVKFQQVGETVDHALQALQDYSLVTFEDAGDEKGGNVESTFEMHRLVRRCVRQWIVKQKGEKGLVVVEGEFLRTMSYVYPIVTPENAMACEKMEDHLQGFMGRGQASMPDDKMWKDSWAVVMTSIGLLRRMKKLSTEADALFQASWNVKAHLYGDRSREARDAAVLVCITKVSGGHHEEALGWCEFTLRCFEKDRAPQDELTIFEVRTAYGIALCYVGRVEEAGQYLQPGILLCGKALQKNEQVQKLIPAALAIKFKHVSFDKLMGDVAAIQATMEVLRHTNGEPPELTDLLLRIAEAVAFMKTKQGKSDEVEQIARCVIALREVLAASRGGSSMTLYDEGGDVDNTYSAQFLLAGACLDQGKLSEAADYYRYTLSVDINKYGRKDARILPSLEGLCFCLQTLEQFDDAKEYLRLNVEVLIDAKGAADPTTVDATHEYGRVLLSLGMNDVALRLFGMLLRVLWESDTKAGPTMPRDMPEVSPPFPACATTPEKQAQHEYLRLRPTRERAVTLQYLGTTLECMKRLRDAEPIERQALMMHAAAAGSVDSNTSRIFYSYTTLLEKLGRHDEATAWRQWDEDATVLAAMTGDETMDWQC